MDTLADNTPVICGGDDAGTCIQFTPAGVWTNYANISDRKGHSSWVSSDGLVLMGGEGDWEMGTSTELVPSGDSSFELNDHIR